jgi:hypothetical protein
MALRPLCCSEAPRGIFGMSQGGAGWLPGTMTHPATPGRFGHTRGDCVCQSVNV